MMLFFMKMFVMWMSLADDDGVAVIIVVVMPLQKGFTPFQKFDSCSPSFG
jgi:hypothetical protein